MSVSISYTQQPYAVNLQGNEIPFVIAVSAANNEYDLYALIELEVTFWDGSTQLLKKMGSIVEDNYCYFDVRELFRNMIESQFAFPENEMNLAIKRNDMIVSVIPTVTVNYKDSNGDAYFDQSTTVGNAFRVINGGIDKDDYAALNDAGTDWWEWFVNSKMFLTYLPGTKTTTRNGMEKLYLVCSENTEHKLFVKYIDSEGETGETEHLFTPNQYDFYEFCVSVSLFESIVKKTIASYTVEIEGVTNPVSFSVIDSPLKEQNFLFNNDLGVPETLHSFGLATENRKYERDLYEKVLDPQYSSDSFEQHTTRAIISNENESNSGYLSKAFKEWASALLQSDRLYHYTTNRIWPIVVKTESQFIDSNTLRAPLALSFTWDYSRKSRYRSALGSELQHILPPYYDKLQAFYYRLQYGTITDKLKGEGVAVAGSLVTFPTLSGNDIFDFTNRTYWDAAIETQTWYNSETPRTCEMSFLKALQATTVGTDALNNVLFFTENETNDARKLRVLVYRSDANFTEDQKDLITKWLGAYITLFDGPDYLADGDDVLTMNHTQIL